MYSDKSVSSFTPDEFMELDLARPCVGRSIILDDPSETLYAVEALRSTGGLSCHGVSGEIVFEESILTSELRWAVEEILRKRCVGYTYTEWS